MGIFNGFHRKQSSRAPMEQHDYDIARKSSFSDLLSMFKSEKKKCLDTDIFVERINHLNVQSGKNSHFNVTVPDSSNTSLPQIMSDSDNTEISKEDTLKSQIADHLRLAKEMQEAHNYNDANEEKKRAEELQNQLSLIRKQSEKDQKLDVSENKEREKTKSEQKLNVKSQKTKEKLQNRDNKPQPKIQKQLNDDHLNSIWENRNQILSNAFFKVKEKFGNRNSVSTSEIKNYVLSIIPKELQPIVEETFNQVQHMSPEEQKQQIQQAKQLQNANKTKNEVENKQKQQSDNEKTISKQSSGISITCGKKNNSTKNKRGFNNMNNQENNFNMNQNNNSNLDNREFNTDNTISSVQGIIHDQTFNEESKLVINSKVLSTLSAIKIDQDKIKLAYPNGQVKVIGAENTPGHVDFQLVSDFAQFKHDLRQMLINSNYVESDFLIPNRFTISL